MGFHFLRNEATRTLQGMFPGLFSPFLPKHNYNVDFGFPDHLSFDQLYQMYCRNGVAKAVVDKTVNKVWQDQPLLQEDDNADEMTPLETDVKTRFGKLRLWQKLAEADRRSLVGEYAGVIFRFADNKRMEEPVDTVPGGLEGLVEIIPAWQGQLTVADFDSDPNSETYAQPRMFSFNESGFQTTQVGPRQPRTFNVHPDRVMVWSRDETVFGTSLLSAGYNDLVTLAKIIGAGGEGFWKNAKAAPILTIEKDANLDTMASAMGVPANEIADKIDAQVKDFNSGFDASLLLQNITAQPLNVNLAQPEQFRDGAMQSIAASAQMPVKILVGMQTGERASQEDAKEWAQTCMGKRSEYVIPNIMSLIERLVRFNVLPEREWNLHWADLTESTMAEKIERADKMAAVNLKHAQAGSMDVVFTDDEIREAVSMSALTDAEKLRESDGEPEEDDSDADI